MDIQVVDEGTFADWADNMGYDADSMKAFNIYKSCLKESKDLKEWLGEKVLKEFLECEE